MAEVISQESICRMKWSTFVLIGVMSILFGSLFFFFPELTAEVVVTLLGIIVIVLAIFAIVLALQSRVGDTYSGFLLFAGIIGFVAGIAAILSPILFGAVVSLIIGVVLLVAGMVNIAMGLSEREGRRPLEHVSSLGIVAIVFAGSSYCILSYGSIIPVWVHGRDLLRPLRCSPDWNRAHRQKDLFQNMSQRIKTTFFRRNIYSE